MYNGGDDDDDNMYNGGDDDDDNDNGGVYAGHKSFSFHQHFSIN